MQLHKISFPIAALMILSAALFFNACEKNDDTAEENITKIEVHLTGQGLDQKFYWNDTDGDDIANSIDTINLPQFTDSIECQIRVYDESQSPAIDLTEEISEEANDHLLVFSASGAYLTVGYKDQDSAGKKLGLKTEWSAGGTSSGKLNIRLYHEPGNKDDLANPGGEVDFNVDFPVRIE